MGSRSRRRPRSMSVILTPSSSYRGSNKKKALKKRIRRQSLQLDDYADKITKLQDEREDDEHRELQLRHENESLKMEREIMQQQMELMQRELQEIRTKMYQSPSVPYSTPTAFPPIPTGSSRDRTSFGYPRSICSFDRESIESRDSNHSLDRESVDGGKQLESNHHIDTVDNTINGKEISSGSD